jgi:hypothetical protein
MNVRNDNVIMHTQSAFSYQKQASRSKTVSSGIIVAVARTAGPAVARRDSVKEEAQADDWPTKDRVGRDKRQAASSVACRQASITTRQSTSPSKCAGITGVLVLDLSTFFFCGFCQEK